MDMWDPYLASVTAHLPDAAGKIVSDKFHIAQHLNDAVDKVRRQENRAMTAWSGPHPSGCATPRTYDALRDLGIRSYPSEPNRKRRNWKKKPDDQAAVYANLRRIRGERGKQLLRLRDLMLKRPFAHALETGALGRVHLRHRENILKRVLIQYAALNLSLLRRH